MLAIYDNPIVYNVFKDFPKRYAIYAIVNNTKWCHYAIIILMK